MLGGKQRKLLQHWQEEEEHNLYDSALILKVDTASGAVHTCVNHKTRPEARAHEHSSSIFKAGTRIGDLLYACTNTEILVYRLPRFELVNYISLPCFNDVHHVTPTRDGALLVVSTGLDMVVRLTPQGDLIEEWSVLPQPPWRRFSREIDYRKVATTKPHESHPNFAFELGKDVWVTRAIQRDAICLTDAGKRLDIALETPHDGLVRDNDIYFTLVDGRLVVARADTLTVARVIDFKVMDDPMALLGWCRGVLPLEDGEIWVGFSRLRMTRFRENVRWVKGVFREGMTYRPTHITRYDTGSGQRLQEFDLERHGMNIIFSILPADD